MEVSRECQDCYYWWTATKGDYCKDCPHNPNKKGTDKK